MKKRLLLLGIVLSAVCGCGQASGIQSVPAGVTPYAPPFESSPLVLGNHKIKHVVVIIQENRSVDNLFNGFPGANTVRSGKNTRHHTVPLVETLLTAPYDLSHKHGSWIQDYNDGNMDGFNRESVSCIAHNRCPSQGVAAYGYVPESEIEPYWQMAKEYVFGDDMFQSNEGPSFPAHQYIISGTSTIANGSEYKASENSSNTRHKRHNGGCDSRPGTTVETIDQYGKKGPKVFPCFTRKSIMDLMNQHDVSWHYYQAIGGAGAWNAVDAIRQIWEGRSYDNVEWPSSRVLTDIEDGHLADVTFVTPTAEASDHAGKTNGSGPSWVASVVNEIGESDYWKSTAIFIVWDDWGGWYDHVTPVRYNSYELGFRVPLIVISPYAKSGYISHDQHEFGSILHFIEKVFNLGSLGTTDARADDLSSCFSFDKPGRAFSKIQTTYGPDYFLRQPMPDEGPDDDF
jgi:phospholipase C